MTETQFVYLSTAMILFVIKTLFLFLKVAIMGYLKRLFWHSENPNSSDLATESRKAIDFKNVYPRIKGLYDDEENLEPFPTGQTAFELSHADSPIIKPYVKGIGVCYMEDKGDSYGVLQNRILSSDFDLERLHSIAIENLKNAVANQCEISGETSDLMMVTNGGNFEAATMLADFFWEELALFFEDEIVIAIPANDLLFVLPKGNTEARFKLKAMINGFFENPETKGLIVKFLYERVNGKWEFLESA